MADDGRVDRDEGPPQRERGLPSADPDDEVAEPRSGDVVLVLEEGNSARQVVDDPKAPLRSVIVGFVDEVEVDGKIVLAADGRAEDGR